MTGDAWPEADEDAIDDLARLWFSVGAEVVRFAPEVTRSARFVASSGALVGDGQQALAAAVALVTGDGDLTLEKLAAGFEELGGYLHRVALQTQYMKIIVIEELIILAAQIGYLIAMIPWTFGASAAGIAALQVFGRQFALALMRQLAIAIAAGEVLQVGLDAIAQLAQIAEGWRKGGEWDWNLTRSAAITGAVGGALGPVFHGLGHYPGKLAGNTLGGVAGKNAGREAGDWAADVVKGAGHEYVTDGASGAVQGQGWRPDTFSLTAGAADEGVSGLAGMGGRKGGHRFSRVVLARGGGVMDRLPAAPRRESNPVRQATSGTTPFGVGVPRQETSAGLPISQPADRIGSDSSVAGPAVDTVRARTWTAEPVATSPDAVLAFVPGSEPGRRALLPYLRGAFDFPGLDGPLRLTRLAAGLMVVRAADDALQARNTAAHPDGRDTPRADDLLRQVREAGVRRTINELTGVARSISEGAGSSHGRSGFAGPAEVDLTAVSSEGARGEGSPVRAVRGDHAPPNRRAWWPGGSGKVDPRDTGRPELLQALSRAAVQVISIGARSPRLAAESVGTLFELAPEVLPGADHAAVSIHVRGARAALLAADPTERGRAEAVARASREVVAAVRSLGPDLKPDQGPDPTAVRLQGSQSKRVAAPLPPTAPAPAPAPAVSPTVPGEGKAGPGRAGAGGWWSGLFQRPMTLATGLPGNDVVIDHPMRAVPPDLSVPRPVPVPASASVPGDPITAAAVNLTARVDSLMEQFTGDQPSLDAFPGRSRLSRIVTWLLPCLSSRPAHEVLTVPERGGVRFFRDAAAGAPLSRVHKVVRAEAARWWSAQPTGGQPREPGIGEVEARPVGSRPVEARLAARLRVLAMDYQAARDRVDTAPAGSDEALRAARALADVADARAAAADLGAYSRLANEEHAGRELLASVELARVRARAWADSVGALVPASTVVNDQLVAEQSLAEQSLAEHEQQAATAEREEARAGLTRATLDLAAAEKARRLWEEFARTPGEPHPAALQEGFDAAVAVARSRHRAADRILTAAERRDTELRERLVALGSGVARVAAPAGNPAVLKATARAGAAIQALDAAHEAGSRVRQRMAEALSTLDRLMVEVATQHPEGFPADGTSDGLRAGLARLVAKLPPAGRDDEIPHLAVLRVITSGLRSVTDDPVRAERLLEALTTHRAAELVPEPGRPDTTAPSSPRVAAEALADLRAFWGVMAAVDRGTEILGIASERHTNPLDSSRVAALTVYWKADAAARALPPVAAATGPAPPVATSTGDAPSGAAQPGDAPSDAAGRQARDREWLDDARRAAAHRVHGGTVGGAAGHERAAYTGVLNGLLSTGPDSGYAQANRWMDTLLETWVQRANTPRSWLSTAWSRLRLADKTPFNARAVGTAQRLAAGFGFSTHDVLADEAVSRGATALASLARERPNVTDASVTFGHGPTDDVLAETWARWVARQPVPGLARRAVTTGDAGSLLGTLSEVIDAAAARGWPAAAAVGWGGRRAGLRRVLLDDLAKATSRGETLTQVVVGWVNRLAPVDGASAGPVLISLKEDLEQALYHLDAAQRPLTSADDVVQLIDPLIREWAIRQNLKLSQGHTIGVSNLALPLFLHKISQKVSFFVVPTVEVGHRRDAFVDLQFPSSLGLQLTIGGQHATSAGGAVTAGPYLTVSGRMRAGLALSLGMRGNWASGDGVVLRLARRRGRDDEHRTRMRQLLADMATWHEARDEHGAPYRDRLEFLLATYPDLTVATVTSGQRTIGGDVTVRAGLPVPVVGRSLVAGPVVSVQATAERTVDVRREGQGQLRMPDDQASIAMQRVRASGGLIVSGGAVPLWSDGPSRPDVASTVFAGPPPGAASVTRELWQRMERRRMDVMISGQKMDAEYDRHTASPEELLAEIRVNRLEWVRRGIDSRPDTPAELRDTLGHDLAAADLTEFEQAIRQVAKATSYAGYTIRYGPRPVARAHADVFGILTELALLRDEPAQARRWNQARNEVLRTGHNWRPRTLLSRERGAQTRNRGLALLLRTQTHDQAEVQRTVVQFPPDSGVGHRTGIHPVGHGPSDRTDPPATGRPDDLRLRWSWGVGHRPQPGTDHDRRHNVSHGREVKPGR